VALSDLAWLVAGLGALTSAVLPRLIHGIPASMPMVFLLFGVVVYALPLGLPDPDPSTYATIGEHLTELVVIVALMGAGLRLDRPLGWRRWGSTWRLLAVTMPLAIGVTALLGWWALGLGAASAVLLGAVLAPTDPVLASDVQVGEPTEEEESEDEVRFALTSEAGLNDGLAFPFTYLAIALVTIGPDPGRWWAHWLGVDVVYRLAAGVGVGWLLGWLLGRLFFVVPSERLRLAEHAEGFVALAATFLAYGVAEVAQAYGFVAVFVCAVSIRAAERASGYHRVLHDFIEQVERLLTVGVLLLLGGAIARGLLAGLTWREVAVGLAVLFVVRPVFGLLALVHSPAGRRERRVIAAFGIRGVGSLYYLFYALGAAPFPAAERLWTLVGFVVAVSVVVYGVAATPVVDRLDRIRVQRLHARGIGEPGEVDVANERV
jgi:sodium/hydrogen antiporter